MIILGSLKDVMPGVDEFINKLIPSWQAFVIQLVATLILFFFVVKFLFKPVREILKKRQDYITANISESEDRLAKAKADEDVASKKLSDLNSQSQEIIDNAKKEAELVKEKKLQETDVEIAEKRASFQREIEQEKIRANDEIRQNIIDVAISASSKILEREISKKDNEHLVDEFIKEVGSTNE